MKLLVLTFLSSFNNTSISINIYYTIRKCPVHLLNGVKNRTNKHCLYILRNYFLTIIYKFINICNHIFYSNLTINGLKPFQNIKIISLA